VKILLAVVRDSWGRMAGMKQCGVMMRAEHELSCCIQLFLVPNTVAT
jgi:hypothetical protein